VAEILARFDETERMSEEDLFGAATRELSNPLLIYGFRQTLGAVTHGMSSIGGRRLARRVVDLGGPSRATGSRAVR
jgi:hypothetical protein